MSPQRNSSCSSQRSRYSSCRTWLASCALATFALAADRACNSSCSSQRSRYSSCRTWLASCALATFALAADRA
ncbi:hypothetical protein KHP57_20910, partial [Algiphilus sp. NNCM1]|nr:hypothetical protein [Algiphilus acroporae]